MENTNPLLNRKNDHRLKAIPFPEFKTEHFLPAIQEALKDAKAEIETLKNNPEAQVYTDYILRAFTHYTTQHLK